MTLLPPSKTRTMLFRKLSFRRTFYTKFILLGLTIVCVLLYLNYMAPGNVISNSTSSRTNNNNNGKVSALLNSETVSLLERDIRLDLAKQVPGLGDNGKSVTLTGEAKERGAKDLAVIALNEELSETLSYNRTVPDARNPLCRNLHYDINSLPTASVVIIFFNEPYSVLVRTIHSVLNTCDRRFLKEIILVDDFSTNKELGEKLDYYIETRFPKDVVKVIRFKSR